MANEPIIPAGMVEWKGGDAAPADWDGGPVLLRCRTMLDPFKGMYWNDEGGRGDIIAYTPRIPTKPESGAADERDNEVAALVVLAEAGISPDIQELLVRGNLALGVAPGALRKVLRAALERTAS